jgi:two-component system, LuxR family, response regulator FixJ
LREAPSRGQDQSTRAAAPPGSALDALVFVVDDDEAVRDAVASSLRAAGYAVADFGSTRQFLDGYRAGQRGCLIVDVDMPGVESELLRMLVSTELALPAIITSRRLRPRALPAALTVLHVVLLEKPFGIDDLLPLVRTALASQADARQPESGIPPT